MPASRSARAITLAPRSCPSRPGLATRTRIGTRFGDGVDSDIGRRRIPQRVPPRAGRGLASFRREPHLLVMRAKSANASVTLPDEQFRAICRALSDPHRYSILQQVAGADGIACSLLEEHAVLSPATVSHHMKELSVAGLIEIRRGGRDAYLSLHRPVLDAYLERLSCL